MEGLFWLVMGASVNASTFPDSLAWELDYNGTSIKGTFV